MASVERSLGMVDYYAMLEIEPGASKTAALHAYYSMRHALLTLGYDQDCQELRDVWKLTTPYHLTTLTSGSSLRPRTLLTDEEERMYYEEEYYIALCAQEDCDGVLEDGDIFSFSSALEVLEANLHWRAAERFVSDNESEIDGDLEYAARSLMKVLHLTAALMRAMPMTLTWMRRSRQMTWWTRSTPNRRKAASTTCAMGVATKLEVSDRRAWNITTEWAWSWSLHWLTGCLGDNDGQRRRFECKEYVIRYLRRSCTCSFEGPNTCS